MGLNAKKSLKNLSSIEMNPGSKKAANQNRRDPKQRKQQKQALGGTLPDPQPLAFATAANRLGGPTAPKNDLSNTITPKNHRKK